jgi:hypothetical protein
MVGGCPNKKKNEERGSKRKMPLKARKKPFVAIRN